MLMSEVRRSRHSVKAQEAALSCRVKSINYRDSGTWKLMVALVGGAKHRLHPLVQWRLFIAIFYPFPSVPIIQGIVIRFH